jgi:hypothetical protein
MTALFMYAIFWSCDQVSHSPSLGAAGGPLEALAEAIGAALAEGAALDAGASLGMGALAEAGGLAG